MWPVLDDGLQDTSTRVWDLRKPKESVAMLCGNMGAIRSLRYSPCGRFLAACEPADFVRLYDVHLNYERYFLLGNTLSIMSYKWLLLL